ncbi:MAG: HD domain-containing protein [Phycisphaerales bacterium]|nr:HD domain-containing protein [Phycisphaerales bacterium]
MAPPSTKKHRRYVNELNPGEFVDDQVFLISAKDLRTTNNGALYIHCILCDKTGQMLGRVWQATESMFEQMPEGGFLRFKGRVENYKGSRQFIVDAMRPADPAGLDLADFIPQTSRDINEMFARVRDILRQIKNRDVLNLIKQFITDEAMMEKFRKAPAAVQNHHAYLGGLLEHTLNVMELALVVIPRYPEVSLDLMLAGVFLHDLGKLAELDYQVSFTYSNAGQLLGHLVQATLWIEDKAKAVEAETGQPFPAPIKEVLQHLVLSHHGSYEFGSPKLPAIPEAIALHHLDNLDAKLNMYLSKIKSDPDPSSDWTEYVRSLETKIYKKNVLAASKNAS